MAPPLTRYHVTLQSDYTRPGEYYHQICALSAKTINANFARMFAQRGDDLADMKFFNGNINDGKLVAKLDAPRVTLQLQNVDEPQILFHVRQVQRYPGALPPLLPRPASHGPF